MKKTTLALVLLATNIGARRRHSVDSVHIEHGKGN
jgi:hypothetical protein